MIAIDFRHDDYTVREDLTTLARLIKICKDHTFSRTFSRWDQLRNVHDILLMLGFSLRHAPSTGNSISYAISYWYGNDCDFLSAHALIQELSAIAATEEATEQDPQAAHDGV